MFTACSKAAQAVYYSKYSMTCLRPLRAAQQKVSILEQNETEGHGSRMLEILTNPRLERAVDHTDRVVSLVNYSC